MSEDIETLKQTIADLENRLEEKENKSDDFGEIKTKYEQVITDKDMEIQSLKDKLEETEEKVQKTVDSLNDEAKQKLEVNEKLEEVMKTIEELNREKAEATVDTFVNQGKIMPSQRDTALKLCLNDTDTFMELYKDAKPIVELKPKSNKININEQGLKDYFKDI
jgi:chromosome segregation ATPase